MKKNRILIISIALAIALVACPIEATRNITAGIGFILGGCVGGMARGTPAERRTEGIRGYCAAVHKHHDDEGGMDRGIGR